MNPDPIEALPQDSTGTEKTTDQHNLELEKKEEEIQTLKEQIKRLQADFENFKKRLEEDVERRKNLAAQELICELLPVVDNLERAMEANQALKKKPVLEGLALIIRQIQKILEKQGVTEICAQGECFDPFLHEAVETVSSNQHPDETIVGVLQKGYKLKHKVIRPSLVKVCRNFNEEAKNG